MTRIWTGGPGRDLLTIMISGDIRISAMCAPIIDIFKTPCHIICIIYHISIYTCIVALRVDRRIVVTDSTCKTNLSLVKILIGCW